MKAVTELRVRITGSTQVPEPTDIRATGDWYYLDHVSSGLAVYNAEKRSFLPMLAESWHSNPQGHHIFKLREGIQFHDGTPITAKDVVWSIKRHLIFKTSTHFPLWEYLVGCENIKTLEDACEGVSENGREITFKLKSQVDSFYLQLASPETGVWSASDMDPKTGQLTPTKFSGPYFLDGRDENSALLKRNPLSRVSEAFPDSPRSIRIKRIPLGQIDDSLLKSDIDLAIKMHGPMSERNWQQDGLSVYSTTPSSIIYLFGLAPEGRRPELGQDFLKMLWEKNQDKILSESFAFLPFSSKFGLTKDQFLSALPEKTAKKIRILYPEGFFSTIFLDQIKAAGQAVGSEIVFTALAPKDFMAAFASEKLGEEYDYILSAYAASERYPAVQLRYLTKSKGKPPIDLKKAESPDSTEDRLQIFHDYEKWLLKSRQATPLYFNVMHIVHQKNIDLGEQSTSDAEIELWRVRSK